MQRLVIVNFHEIRLFSPIFVGPAGETFEAARKWMERNPKLCRGISFTYHEVYEDGTIDKMCHVMHV